MKNRCGKPNWRVTDKMRVRARSLRRESTGAERIIWSAVRAHRLSGASFRRQVPIGPSIVDFVCHDARLIVEIDGGQHFEAEHLVRDARRDVYLRAKGFQVLRFDNREVMTNRVGVLSVIDNVVAKALSLPQEGEGNPQTTTLSVGESNTPSPPLPRRRGREGNTEPLS